MTCLYIFLTSHFKNTFSNSDYFQVYDNSETSLHCQWFSLVIVTITIRSLNVNLYTFLNPGWALITGIKMSLSVLQIAGLFNYQQQFVNINYCRKLSTRGYNVHARQLIFNWHVNSPIETKKLQKSMSKCGVV